VINDKVFDSYELENRILDFLFNCPMSLDQYFLDFMSSINSFGLPQYKQQKIETMKQVIIRTVYQYRYLNPNYAQEIKKLFN
jgi:hypothetical protein